MRSGADLADSPQYPPDRAPRCICERYRRKHLQESCWQCAPGSRSSVDESGWGRRCSCWKNGRRAIAGRSWARLLYIVGACKGVPAGWRRRRGEGKSCAPHLLDLSRLMPSGPSQPASDPVRWVLGVEAWLVGWAVGAEPPRSTGAGCWRDQPQNTQPDGKQP